MKTGDIFEVQVGAERVRFFQFIGRDITQLNSDVIRIFLGDEPLVGARDWEKIAGLQVEFHVHVAVKLGVKLKCWHHVGHGPVDAHEVLFRISADYGNPSVKKSTNWAVWRMNEPMIDVGVPDVKLNHSDLGVVIPPQWVLEKIKTGIFPFIHPTF